ncbi:MAG TPA: serine hydrolase domain-containing protein [Acidimicrobiales bacterium]|nr:serine hydrolase domain-containing protein [Acidimicrobiales bacterium]
MQSLGLIDDFGADHVAAAVVGRSGDIVGLRGDLEFHFPLASVTKLLTAMSIFVAVEEQTLAFSDPAGPNGSTVRHLLSHASGLSQHDRKIALAVPGAKRIYSNVGFEVLGDYLAERSEIAFEEYLTTGVLAPLSMDSTTCLGSAAAAGASTIGDVAKFIKELLNPSLVSYSLMEEATSVAFPGLAGVVPGFGRQDPCDWGLGFEIKSSKYPHWTGEDNSERSYGHFGQSGTFVLIDPAAGFGIGLLSDRRFGPWSAEAWPPFCDAVFRELRHLSG